MCFVNDSRHKNGGMELVSLRYNRYTASSLSYGFGWYEYVVASQWYQLNTTKAWWFSVYLHDTLIVMIISTSFCTIIRWCNHGLLDMSWWIRFTSLSVLYTSLKYQGKQTAIWLVFAQQPHKTCRKLCVVLSFCQRKYSLQVYTMSYWKLWMVLDLITYASRSGMLCLL